MRRVQRSARQPVSCFVSCLSMSISRLRPFLLLNLFDDDDNSLTDHGKEAGEALLQLAEKDLWSLLSRFREELEEPVSFDETGGDETETRQQTVVYSLTVAVFLTIRLKSSELMFFMPSVHSHLFALQQILPLVAALLARSEAQVTRKGLYLMNHLLQNLGEGAIPADFYDLLKRYPAHKSLVNVMRYSKDASSRTEAIRTYKRLLSAFDPPGRLRIINAVICDPDQSSGVIELVLIQYRAFLTHDRTGLYAGQNLKQVLLNSIPSCFRPAARPPQTPPVDDLLHRSESILGLLNFIRFLCLNRSYDSVIRDLTPVISDRLIAPLKQELEVTKANLLQELRDVSELGDASKAEGLDHLKKMRIQIGNDSSAENIVDECPEDFQEQAVQMALIKLDMIQSVVDRVQELLA